jgi:hypothetical protein
MSKYSNIDTLTDGSIVMTLEVKHVDEFYNHDGNEGPEWDEVYGIVSGNDINPIPGKYYCVGSGDFIIISNDAIYKYQNEYDQHEKCYKGMQLTRLEPLSCIMIQPVKQSDLPHDDIISYIRIITKIQK